MIQKFKKYIFVAVASLAMLAPGLAPAVVGVASADTISSGLCTGANNATGGTNSTCTSGDGTVAIKDLAKKLINIFSILVGIIAVIMLIFGGFKYITSGGDSNSITAAKNTLIYAIVGLLVVALAQFIVVFVLSTASSIAPAA